MNSPTLPWFEPLVQFIKRHFHGDAVFNEPLEKHTWYKIGGQATCLAYPHNIESLIQLLQKCRELKVPVFMLGDGANLLVHDDGFNGLVIKLSRYINTISFQNGLVYCGAGVLLGDLVLWCESHGLGGLQGLAGVPGTVGGALRMNAGTNRGNIGTVVQSVGIFNKNYQKQTIQGTEIDFGYREAPALEKVYITDCTFKLEAEDSSLLKEIRISQINERAAKQPVNFPSCGSVFKRPRGYFVGKMVQDLGLKGLKYGDAMISPKHGGFIVNCGSAKATDVFYLIETVKEKVFKSYGVRLEPEVKFLGF